MANAISAIGSLALDRRIPPAIEMHHMRSAGQIEPGAAGLDRENEKRRALVFLKCLDEVTAFGDRRVAMESKAWTRRFRKTSERRFSFSRSRLAAQGSI